MSFGTWMLRWDIVLLGARAAFLVFSFALATIAFARWRRAVERDTAHTSQQLTRVLERLDQLEATLARYEPRLHALAEQLEETPPQTAATPAPGNYQVAIRLARSGATVAELMSGCGLSRQEADLVARLHCGARRSRDARPAVA
jgi:septal ring factor EnvC (AmiA/AmiB activator)